MHMDPDFLPAVQTQDTAGHPVSGLESGLNLGAWGTGRHGEWLDSSPSQAIKSQDQAFRQSPVCPPHRAANIKPKMAPWVDHSVSFFLVAIDVEKSRSKMAAVMEAASATATFLLPTVSLTIEVQRVDLCV